MRSFFLPCLFVLLAGRLPAEEKKTDQDQFQGEWAVVKIEQQGEDLPDYVKDNSPAMIYKAGKYTFKLGGSTDEAGEFKLDPRAKLPTLDYTITEGVHKGKRQLGIYKLDGDSLTICLNEEGADARPAKFKTGAGAAEYVLFTMKRKK
jgi:uncharacterized protein (TIGR03067 family)